MICINWSEQVLLPEGHSARPTLPNSVDKRMTGSWSWLIGGLEDCDLTVPDSIVSGRHCRLTRDASGYRLEDLDSTNGTYVNGTRITGATTVSRRRQHHARKEPSRCRGLSKIPVTTVPGRSRSSGSVAIPATMLLSMTRLSRCFMPRSSSRKIATWFRDLDSTNGTAVGSADKLVQTAEIRSTDVLFFGSHRMPASQLISDRRPDRISVRIRLRPAGRNRRSPSTASS